MHYHLLPTAILMALSALGVNAHGTIMDPRIEFKNNFPDSPAANIEGYQAMPPTGGMSYSGSPESNTKAFNAAMKANGYKSLKEFSYAKFDRRYYDPKCGFSKLGSPQKLPDQITFGFKEYNIGFFEDHQGPCEMWCDDVRVMADDNCALTYRQRPGANGYVKIPYDRAKCANAKEFSFYWIAVHNPRWQVYINCAAIQGGGGGGGDDNNGGDSDTPKPTTMKPTPTTTMPTPTSSPSPMTPGPSPTKKTCVKKNKRLRV